jgi:hypothetical protein
MSRKVDPNKLKAWHVAARYDLKPEKCEKCGELTPYLKKHHPDYRQPTHVVYLCQTCHMRLHHGAKKDNSTFARKVSLRMSLLKQIQDPVIMETHGGEGHIFLSIYSDIQHGVVFEKDHEKSVLLAHQRHTWAVYEGDSAILLAGGAGKHLEVNFLDVDPYGDPWPAINAFFGSARPFPPTLAVAVNDGLMKKLKMQGGWAVQSLRPMIERYGNANLYKIYLDVAREFLIEKAVEADYKLDSWTAYLCGHMRSMAHYGGIFRKT